MVVVSWWDIQLLKGGGVYVAALLCSKAEGKTQGAHGKLELIAVAVSSGGVHDAHGGRRL